MTTRPLRVLFVTSEMYPLAHTGGLGDVSAALPAALRELGVDIRVMLPAYPSALERVLKKAKPIDIGSPAGLAQTSLIPTRTPGTDVPLWLVDAPALFSRPGGVYGDERGRDWPDNAARFALLSHAAAIVAGVSNPVRWTPDVVHANDWQTGLVPVLLATRREPHPPTVLSIHNLSFLGLFPRAMFPILGLPTDVFQVDGLEFYGDVSFLKGGIYFADRLTTVSPTYAREILTPEFGCGLDGLLKARAASLVGILNGVDYARWDPARDPHVAMNYSADSLEGKRACKAALQRELGLEVRSDALLLGSVSRLTPQKGSDLLVDAVPEMLKANIQLAFLGSGMSELEQAFAAAMTTHRGRVAGKLGYDEPLSHRIEAGADAFVMPSRFEPCGLNQMYSMKYGTPPIVHRVGGLADTVSDGETGFVFERPTSAALVKAVQRAVAAYTKPAAWRTMQLRGMAQDFSWQRAAKEYLTVYRSLPNA